MPKDVVSSSWLRGLCGLALVAAWALPCDARDFVDGFDSADLAWKVVYDKSSSRLTTHRRNHHLLYAGAASENIEIETFSELTTLQLEYPLPPSRLLDDLKLSLWFRSNRDGAQLAVRVVFPHQVNPKTGDQLTVLLEGAEYSRVGTWQRLECAGLDRLLRQKMPQLRQMVFGESESRRDLNARGLYIDRAVFRVQTGKGATEFFLDELRLGPVVPPTLETPVARVAHEDTAAPQREMELRLDRLQFRGRPMLPRILPHHGERIEELVKLGVNLVWIPDYQDGKLLAELQQHGLRAVASPPRPRAADGDLLPDDEAVLAPFGPETSAIACWMIGNRIPSSDRDLLLAWTEQVRNADRRFQRPLIGDVLGLENTYSRELPLFGASRHVLQGSFGLKTYRNWLVERRQLAQPGAFLWTWVQTEPVQSLAEGRGKAQLAPAVVEPEQIRLQVYAALAAGCRGLGFWSHSSLEEDRPGNVERKLAIAQLNMELQLIEPWIATGAVQTQAPFTAQLPRGGTPNQLALDYASSKSKAMSYALLRERKYQLDRQNHLGLELEAAILRTDFGYLLLPVWYGRGAEFVPDQMEANDALIVVPGADESVSAWEVSTTGLQNLTRKRVTGGVQVTIPKFDMTSMVILTSDRSFKDRLQQKMETMRETSAQVSWELAQAKLQRVSEVDRRLHALGVGQLDSARLLSRAQTLLDQAQAARQRRDFHMSRLLSNGVLRVLRILQRASWNDAVLSLPQPVVSPHAVCYQTLPDHWSLLTKIGRSPSSPRRNLLRSGDFEDFDAMLADGWKHAQQPCEGVRATAELYPQPHQGDYCLRLVAVPRSGSDPPAHIADRPVTVTTAPIPVTAGQIVYIGGWVRVVAAGGGNLDGTLFWDSVGGPPLALRWRQITSGWEHFELLREVGESGELTCTMALSGLADVYFDDLQVICYDVNTSSPETSPAGVTPTSWANPLELIRRLPGLKPAASTDPAKLPPRR